MSRINTNISSLQAIHRLNKNNSDLSTRLQRLSSGMKINSGKDAPAGLIASETLRSEIAGINQAVDNSGRAANVLNTAEGSLSEVSSLLLEVQTLTNQAANNGALSSDEIAANQLQVDSIINTINRISNTTVFNGVKLLNGNFDYTASTPLNGDNFKVAAARLPDNQPVNVVATVTASARTATLGRLAGALASNTTIEIAGNAGTEQLTFAAGADNPEVMAAVNAISNATGVVAALSSNGNDLRLSSANFGSSQFVSVKLVNGAFATVGGSKANGQDASVIVNGALAHVEGTHVSYRDSNLDVSFDLNAASNITNGTAQFKITGGGASFQLGARVDEPDKASLGIGSIAAGSLGDSIDGYLSELSSGGSSSLSSGNLVRAQRIIDTAIKQVATLRGRLGAFQKDTLDTNINSLNVALENVTASESAIRDADFASETAAMTRAQILVQANTSVLAQANAAPQNVLALLKGG